ncbi:SDR family oxidoreductase [Herbaspirillum sp. NPDC087042]|uniref:SDR family oxidoreductase n=1 Tax=Herbaspirillum sp. NPDC087042 TaxID=3364004 RepID=UPI0037FA6502
MDLKISGRRALVMSAGGGLGSEIALALAAEGVEMYLADRDAAALDVTAQRIREAGGNCSCYTWDLAQPNQWQAGIEQVLQRAGTIDILVNNTGGPPPGPAHGHSTAVWRNAFESMVLSVIGITDLLLPGMREQRWGRIITSTSSGVVAPIANLGLSNATRISLLGWSKSLAREVARDGVTVNVVVPGRIATRRTQFLDAARAEREGRAADDIEKESAASIAMGRYGRPEEYADVVSFLASERASYVTGSTVRVDGGLIASI